MINGRGLIQCKSDQATARDPYISSRQPSMHAKLGDYVFWNYISLPIGQQSVWMILTSFSGVMGQ